MRPLFALRCDLERRTSWKTPNNRENGDCRGVMSCSQTWSATLGRDISASAQTERWGDAGPVWLLLGRVPHRTTSINRQLDYSGRLVLASLWSNALKECSRFFRLVGGFIKPHDSLTRLGQSPIPGNSTEQGIPILQALVGLKQERPGIVK